MKTFRDRVAVVTGAGSGIGRALSIQLAKDGAAVAISDINEQALEETAALTRKETHKRVTTRKLDVANKEDVHAWADEVVAEHGSAHLIVNNAGVALAGLLRKVRYEDFEWLMNIDFWGVVYGSLAFLPHIEKSGGGQIVNISSVFGIIAAPMNGTYNAAKFAVRGFTEALRIELEMEGSPVGVTCVHPGGIKTNIARAARVRGDDGLTPHQVSSEFDRMAHTTPEQCAKTILRGAARNAPRVLVGADAYLIDKLQRLAPTGYQAGVKALLARSPNVGDLRRRPA